MSALLGRIPSAVGYQPTLATDMGTMQERITTTKKGSITSVQVNIHSYHASQFNVVKAKIKMNSRANKMYMTNKGKGRSI